MTGHAAVAVEVRTRTGWRPLRAPVAPQVGESDLLQVRNVLPGAVVTIADRSVTAGTDGRTSLWLKDEPGLAGHLGLIEVLVDGEPAGEIDVIADKLSAHAYATLRADLERVWSGLALDPDGVSHERASLPPPDALWARIESALASIVATPREHLVSGVAVRRLERVRRPRELTPSLLRAGLRGGAGLARVVDRSIDTPEAEMVTDTLWRLLAYASRHPDGERVATRIGPLVRARGGTRGARRRSTGNLPLTFAMRSDHRYRKVHEVHRLLQRPDLEPVDGPGELRLGVKGMHRLYEYWVFLQVLVAAAERYGPPEPPGFAVLRRYETNGRVRLELAAGTTVTFPGGVHVAFEPAITTRGDGWRDLELVPHPDAARYPLRTLATPDVVVLRDAPHPWVTVIDAKYVGRARVEAAAAECHAKYARMRLDGRPVVRHVFVAHPHPGLDMVWAGYGSIPMTPGEPPSPLPLPMPREP